MRTAVVCMEEHELILRYKLTNWSNMTVKWGKGGEKAARQIYGPRKCLQLLFSGTASQHHPHHRPVLAVLRRPGAAGHNIWFGHILLTHPSLYVKKIVSFPPSLSVKRLITPHKNSNTTLSMAACSVDVANGLTLGPRWNGEESQKYTFLNFCCCWLLW